MANILAIEDDPIILENILEILRLGGHSPVGAYNGADGLELLETFMPDIILCDIQMPIMDGYTCLLNVRSQPHTNLIPFIFLTAFADRDAVRRGMTKGADDYLTKPITPRDLLEAVTAQLNRAADHKRATDTALEQLRQNMTLALPHELRTPLTGIITGSDILLMDFDDNTFDRNRIHHMLKIINNAGHRLQSLIENYLFYAQLELMGQTEEGRSRLQHGTGIADPSLILFDSVQQAAEAANRANDIVWCDRLDLWVDISDGNLARIVHEIIDNALKFSKPGTPIELALQTTPHYYIIHITDHGYGMSEENIRKVGAFMQFDRKTREQQGAGLGLVIAQRLTALHGGQLQIESQLGVGTKVSIQLPLIPEPA